MSDFKTMPTEDDYWAKNPARQALKDAEFIGTTELFAALRLPRDFWRSDKVEKETGIPLSVSRGVQMDIRCGLQAPYLRFSRPLRRIGLLKKGLLG